MNDTSKAILNRRSIRIYKTEQLNRKDVDAIIEAGCYAPSANNAQNWHFTIVQNKLMIDKVNGWILNEIENSGNPSLQEMAKRGDGSIFRNAPTIVIVSTDIKDRFDIINAAAATENLLIAAESLEIGSCWIGMVAILAGSKNVDSYAKDLQLPHGYVPQIGITLGYKTSTNPVAPARSQNCMTYIQ